MRQTVYGYIIGNWFSVIIIKKFEILQKWLNLEKCPADNESYYYVYKTMNTNLPRIGLS